MRPPSTESACPGWDGLLARVPIVHNVQIRKKGAWNVQDRYPGPNMRLKWRLRYGHPN
jgi:hypothetical protein